ncbi:MAG TPA: sigma-54 dependent transcriptional regulator [Steroidobacteraceae bacterium]|jgi:DNA-binding NtrC family response regulator|nr:sigma-54 dependent transcriptional regulator [Steroidobacteraceae bacterium]
MNAGKILVVDDEADIRRLLQEILMEEGYEVEVAADARQARAARQRQAPDLVLLDIWMPDTDGITLLREWSGDAPEGCPVVMMSGHGTVETAVEATRLGAFDFIEKPVSLAKLLRTVERALEVRARRHSGKFVGAGSAASAAPPGRSRTMVQLRADLTRLAASAAPILLLGEPGTELEQLARFVHQSGPAAAGPFVVLDARTLREETTATTLFGSDQVVPGVFEQARGGTLFISNIEDLPPAAQRLLSGVIENGSFMRAGATRGTGQGAEGDGQTVPLRARIIASAQPGIMTRVIAEQFRRDLYAQLSVLLVRVPALRDYAEDVPELLRYYVDLLTETAELRFRRFGVAAQNRLRHYPWPDNVRELRNMTRRFLLADGPEEIGLEEVERELSAQTQAGEPLVKHDLLALPLREAREQFERAYLQQQLQLCNGKVGLLAKRVDMERTHLYRKLRSLGIEIGHGAEE